MQARDVMTTEVVAVHPDAPVAEIARLLLERRISAVPVADADGTLVGMVSEGDLIGRAEPERQIRSDWWLDLLAGTEAAPAPLPEIRDRVARQVMSSPVVTVTEETELSEIAHLLAQYGIKRVPVMRRDRIVGIVSRADLLRGLAATAPARAETDRPGLVGRIIAELDKGVLHRAPPAAAVEAPRAAPHEPSPAELAAAKFQDMVKAFKREKVREQEERHELDMERRRERTAELSEHHLTEEMWQGLLQRALDAARRGETEFLMLRFPSQLCSDGGRAVNAPEPTWPETLRGEAAELYLRWEREIKPNGFALAARVLDYPGGMPGDIGLFLSWGEAAG